MIYLIRSNGKITKKQGDVVNNDFYCKVVSMTATGSSKGTANHSHDSFQILQKLLMIALIGQIVDKWLVVMHWFLLELVDGTYDFNSDKKTSPVIVLTILFWVLLVLRFSGRKLRNIFFGQTKFLNQIDQVDNFP